MPRYKYKAINPDGSIKKGETDSPSYDMVIRNLQEAGSLPIEAMEITQRHHIHDFIIRLTRWKDSVTQQDIGIFFNELATLLNAGLPLDHALKSIINLTVKLPIKNIAQTLYRDIQDGNNLSTAMKNQANIFTPLQISMVKAGEAGGELHTVIKELSDYMERMSDVKNSVITALIYPAILLLMSVLSLFVMLIFVVPKFVPLFEDAGQTLPLLTQITFVSANFIQNTWWIFLCIVIVIAWYSDTLLAKPGTRIKFDGWCLKRIYFGNLIKIINTARFTRTLGILIRNGVPLLMAIKLVKNVITNQMMADAIQSSIHEIEQGKHLSHHLVQSGVFPPLCTQLIEVGEQSGNLDQMLIKIADIYDQELQKSLKKMLTLLEPVLILGLGGLIGFIIISILLAMLGMNELIL